MAELQVSDDGLRVQAGWCESLAGRLAGNTGPAGAGSSVLASSAAVGAAHAQIAAAFARDRSRRGGMPGLPFGGGMPWDAPATGPDVIHPHKPGQHHRMPLLGELPDDYDD